MAKVAVPRALEFSSAHPGRWMGYMMSEGSRPTELRQTSGGRRQGRRRGETCPVEDWQGRRR